MTEVKDLTYSKGQKKSKLKEIIGPDGTKHQVPHEYWRATVLRDPMGATAQLAARNKDPDLDKIRVADIPIKSFVEVPIVDLGKPDEPIQPPIISRPLISNLNQDTAKRLGFRSAEHGKNRGKEI